LCLNLKLSTAGRDEGEEYEDYAGGETQQNTSHRTVYGGKSELFQQAPKG